MKAVLLIHYQIRNKITLTAFKDIKEIMINALIVVLLVPILMQMVNAYVQEVLFCKVMHALNLLHAHLDHPGIPTLYSVLAQ